MLFSELGLSPKVLAAVEAAGYREPTPIQAQAIPHALQRRDVLGIAQTGTGKTASFTLPMLTLLEQGRARARMPRTLIVEPTRELAAQVEESFIKYGTNHNLSVALLIGGVSFGDQDMKITRGVDVLIATPGRLLDHFERGKLLLSGIEILVIDEADRMLDMGFIPDIERICKLVPFTRQTLFFSATMPPEITRLTEQFLHNPVRVEVAPPATAAATITQRLVASGSEPHSKRDTLRRLIRSTDGFKNAIIFLNRKRDVAILHRSLERHGFNAVALHGDLDQHARMAALDRFKTGDAQLLVASDVAARGLDIPDVSHVFNFDVPHHAEDYIHRIGRTGRAGKSGTALTIVGGADKRALADIEKLIGNAIEWQGAPPADGDSEDDGEHRRGRGANRRGEREGRRSDGRRGAPRPTRGGPPSPAERPRERAAEPAEAPRSRPAPSARTQDDKVVPIHRAPPRERAPERHEPAVTGFGDHMPSFLMRAVKVK